VKRWPPLVLILALLVGGLVLGREGSERERTAAADIDPATLLPVAGPDDALDGSWFCAGQTGGEETGADGTLVIANVGDSPAVGTVEAVAVGADEPVVERVEIAARSTERVAVADLVEADWVAAQVQVEGGTVVVEHEVTGEQGRDAAPCQSRASSSWLLPSGASTRDAGLTLAIYNPYPGEARVDLAFTTDESVREPSDLQGLSIAPGAVVAIDVSSVVTERPVLASRVTATRGQVVVDRVQTFNGEGAATTEEEAEAETYLRQGLTVTPAIPEAARTWAFPAGLKAGFVHEQIVLFNPDEERTAEVELTVDLDDPQRNGTLEPFPVTVPPGAFSVFDVDSIETIPDGVTHSITARSENDVPIYAERTLAAAGEDAPYTDTAASTGSPLASERWAFATGPADDEAGRYVVVNPGTEPVEVTLTAFGDGDDEPVEVPVIGGDEDETAPSFTLEPGARREIAVEGLDEDRRSVEVVATGPVVAERRLFFSSTEEVGQGASVALGIPRRQGLIRLR
jgi:hypothetical protein